MIANVTAPLAELQNHVALRSGYSERLLEHAGPTLAGTLCRMTGRLLALAVALSLAHRVGSYWLTTHYDFPQTW